MDRSTINQVGANPSSGAQKVLERVGILPRKQISFGYKFTYEKKPKQYYLHDYQFLIGSNETPQDFVRNKINQELTKLEENRTIELQALQKFKDDIENMDTSNIESDEEDIQRRVIKFTILTRRLEKWKENSGKLKGSDYQTNIYRRKMQKLLKHGNY